MSGIVFLIERIAVGLYVLIGAGVLWYWRKYMMAQYAYRATTFELERDFARSERGNALTVLVVLIQLGLVVVGIQQVVAPTMRADLEAAAPVEVAEAPEDGVFVTPTRPVPSGQIPVDASGIDLGDTQEQGIFVTPTLTPTPVGTIEPNAPAALGCDSPNAMLQIPANGMRVFQVIRVEGTAFVEDFSEYKLELSGPGTFGQFLVIDQGITPVEEMGTLSQFNPDPYEPGEYKFRLMVFDTTSELRAFCEVTIYITDPIPTPTPIGE
ncbi:MAG: hypothetical protein ACOCXR_02245 [Phototrophicaceae bacterium]